MSKASCAVTGRVPELFMVIYRKCHKIVLGTSALILPLHDAVRAAGGRLKAARRYRTPDFLGCEHPVVRLVELDEAVNADEIDQAG